MAAITNHLREYHATIISLYYHGIKKNIINNYNQITVLQTRNYYYFFRLVNNV